MSHDYDIREKAMMWLICGVGVGAAAAGAGYLLIQVGEHVLKPVINAMMVFYAQYGKATAEVFTISFIVGYGLKLHDQTITTLNHDYVTHVDKKEEEIKSLKLSINLGEGRNARLHEEMSAVKAKEKSYQEKIKLLEAETEALKFEMKCLQEPEAFFQEELIAEQKRREESVTEVIQNIKWGVE